MKKTFSILISTIVILLCFTCLLIACKATTFEVRYYDDVNLLKTVTLEKGQDLYSFLPPEKEGYTFIAWYTENSLQNEIKPTTRVSSNTSLYAKYQIKQYTITFQIEGHDDIQRSVEYNQSITDPPEIPEKEGFIGEWSQQQLSNIKSHATIQPTYKPIMLSIIFVIDGQTYAQREVQYGESLKDIPTVPEKEGKECRWDIASFENITSNLVITPIYTDKVCTISFISKHPETEEEYVNQFSLLYNQDFNTSQRPQPRSFFGYEGTWDEENVIYTKVTTDLNIQALYTPLDFSITFKTDSQIEHEKNITITMPFNSIPHDYIGDTSWETLGLPNEEMQNNLLNPRIEDLDKPDERNIRYGNSYTDIFAPLRQDNIQMYIIYDVFIIFHTNGGEFADDSGYSVDNPYKVTYNNYISPVILKHREGYNFINWYSDEQYNDIFYFNEPFQKDTNLYALWEEIYCNVSFPTNILDITFTYDTSLLPVRYGEDFSFSINIENTEENTINEIWANTFEMDKTNNHEYTLKDIKEDINIAIKTNSIDIHTLRFYKNINKEELLYETKISTGEKLSAVPEPIERYLTLAFWQYRDNIFDFNTNKITEDMDFFIKYIELYYYIKYVTSDNSFISLPVEYEDTSFSFYSPTAAERPENKLFKGWFIDRNLITPATKNYVITKGEDITLYPKWVDEQETVPHDIIGLWYNNKLLLEFFSNSAVKIYDKTLPNIKDYYLDGYMECSFELNDNVITIMGEQATIDEEGISFRGRLLQRTQKDKNFIYLSHTNLLLIEEFEGNLIVPLNEEIPSYYWFTDRDYTRQVDIMQPLNPSLFINRTLRLYHSSSKYIDIIYDAKGGTTEGNKENDRLKISNTVMLEEQLVSAHKADHLFRGWIVDEETKELLTLDYLFHYTHSTITVYASYIEEKHITEQFITGNYVGEQDGKLYIISFDLDSNQEYLIYNSYTVSIIDLNTNTYSVSVPLIYSGSLQEGFWDENNRPIRWENNTIIMHHQDLELELTSHLIDEEYWGFYKYRTPENIFKLIYIDSSTIKTKDSSALIYYCSTKERFYYFYQENQLTQLASISKNSLEDATTEIPIEHLGCYHGKMTFDEEEYTYLTVDITSENSVTLYLYEDEEHETLLHEQETAWISHKENYYVLADMSNQGETRLEIIAFFINNEDDNYYFEIEGLQFLLQKEDEEGPSI